MDINLWADKLECLPCDSCVHVYIHRSLWCRSSRPRKLSMEKDCGSRWRYLDEILFDSFPVVSQEMAGCWVFFMIAPKPVILCWCWKIFVFKPVFNAQVFKILLHLKKNNMKPSALTLKSAVSSISKQCSGSPPLSLWDPPQLPPPHYFPLAPTCLQGWVWVMRRKECKVRCWRMVDNCFSKKKVWTDRPDQVGIMPIL